MQSKVVYALIGRKKKIPEQKFHILQSDRMSKILFFVLKFYPLPI